MTELKEAPRTKATGMEGREKASALALRTGSPFGLMKKFAEEMDRLFEEFGMGFGWHMPAFLTQGHELLRRESGLIEADWSPRIDVKEKDGKLYVRADLPGMNKDEVKVELTEHLLTIEGERKEEKKEEREGYRYSERAYGKFYRALPLPEGAMTEKATAEFHQGVLEIVVPLEKKVEPQARRIQVTEKK